MSIVTNDVFSDNLTTYFVQSPSHLCAFQIMSDKGYLFSKPFSYILQQQR